MPAVRVPVVAQAPTSAARVHGTSRCVQPEDRPREVVAEVWPDPRTVIRGGRVATPLQQPTAAVVVAVRVAPVEQRLFPSPVELVASPVVAEVAAQRSRTETPPAPGVPGLSAIRLSSGFDQGRPMEHDGL